MDHATKCFSHLAALAALVASPAEAFGSQLDQVNLRQSDDRWVSFNASEGRIHFQQEVVAGVEGVLAGVDLYPWFAETSFQFFVNKGAGRQHDAHDFEAIVTPNVENRLPLEWPETSNPFHIDVSSANIRVAAGETFVIGFRGTNSGQSVHGTVLSAIPGPLVETEPGYYAAGRLFVKDDFLTLPPSLQVGFDMAFRTHVRPIPEPSGLFLFTMAAGFLCQVGGMARQHYAVRGKRSLAPRVSPHDRRPS